MAVKAAKVSLYAWQGTDRTGRKMSGESSAQTPALIKAQLRQRGIIPGKVRKKFAPLFSAGQRVTAQDIALFTRQMATMLKAITRCTWPIAKSNRRWRWRSAR